MSLSSSNPSACKRPWWELRQCMRSQEQSGYDCAPWWERADDGPRCGNSLHGPTQKLTLRWSQNLFSSLRNKATGLWPQMPLPGNCSHLPRPLRGESRGLFAPCSSVWVPGSRWPGGGCWAGCSGSWHPGTILGAGSTSVGTQGDLVQSLEVSNSWGRARRRRERVQWINPLTCCPFAVCASL